VDAKLIARYGLALSKWARARRREKGEASVHLVRLGRFFVLLATKGKHAFFDLEGDIRDVRRAPLRVGGYSISYRQGVDRRYHVSVRIAPDEYLRLKSFLVGITPHRSVENLTVALRKVPFEPYAPVRRQLLNILRAMNRARKVAGLELVPVAALRLRRRVVKPFGGDRLESSNGSSAVWGRPRQRSP
jgi:hypothetical protein